MAATVPVIAVVGASGSGKTLLLEALIAELTRRGYRVGAIKHSHSGFELDIPGKDTWRYAAAGAAGVAISSRGRVGAIRRVEGELAPEEVAALLPDVDVVLAEGFGGASWPKVEVRGRGEGERRYEKVVAVVGGGGQRRVGPRAFGLDDVQALAGFLEEGWLRPGGGR